VCQEKYSLGVGAVASIHKNLVGNGQICCFSFFSTKTHTKKNFNNFQNLRREGGRRGENIGKIGLLPSIEATREVGKPIYPLSYGYERYAKNTISNSNMNKKV